MAVLAPGTLLRIRDERWRLVRSTRHGVATMVEVRGCDRGNHGNRATFVLPFEPLDIVTSARTPRLVGSRAWRHAARQALSASTPRYESLRAAARARIELLPYQLEPALALMRGDTCRILIADAVGLGKTIQAGLVLGELLARDPDAHMLVVCPAGLRDQWREELRSRFGLDAVMLDARAVGQLASLTGSAVNPWSAAPLIITSIDYVKRPDVMRALEPLVWDALVIDEAHGAASVSDRATAVDALAARARRVVLLSATPHSGDTAAFDRLCSLGDPGRRCPLTLFRRGRADAGIPSTRRTRTIRIRPTLAEQAMHALLERYAREVWAENRNGARLGVTVLLRRATSSAGALARSLARRLALLSIAGGSRTQLALPFEARAEGDEEPDAVLGAPGLADVDRERRILDTLLARARAAEAMESKLCALRRFVRRTREPLLVFTEYRDTLERVRDALGDHSAVLLHGGLSRRERHQAALAFSNGTVRLMLATDAASEGLNLHQRCRCVLNLELPWNPVRLEQRAGRVDRLGQRGPVHAIRLVAAGTTEERLLTRLTTREATAAAALAHASPREDEMAATVIGEEPLPAPADTLEPPMLALDLRADAEIDAAWIATARQLDEPDRSPATRPVITRTRRQGRAILGFETTLEDPDGRALWRLVIGIRASRTQPRVATRAAARALTEALAAAVTPDATRLVADAMAVIARASEQRVAREQQIAAIARLRHARIAADLLQPGLFDRRAERAAAAQAAALEEVLDRCTAQLERLRLEREARPSAPQLVFGLTPF